jgi:hypothetical protein
MRATFRWWVARSGKLERERDEFKNMARMLDEELTRVEEQRDNLKALVAELQMALHDTRVELGRVERQAVNGN